MKRFAPKKVKDLDRALFRAIFGVKWGPLNELMRAFTVAGKMGAMWGVLAFLAFVVTGFELYNLLVPWVAVAGSWFVSEGLKHLVDRTRPFIADTSIAPIIKTPSSSSFPSGHAATAAAGPLTLSVLYPAFAPALVLAGLLVVVSRVYLGVHYPLDVLAGVLIGLVTAAAVLAVA